MNVEFYTVALSAHSITIHDERSSRRREKSKRGGGVSREGKLGKRELLRGLRNSTRYEDAPRMLRADFETTRASVRIPLKILSRENSEMHVSLFFSLTRNTIFTKVR